MGREPLAQPGSSKSNRSPRRRALRQGVQHHEVVDGALEAGSRDAHSRLPQLAPLWAIGLTRRRLATIELLKTMSVALITTLLALPLGLLVAWCLIAVVNVKAFGWRLPFHVFPLQLIELLGVAMAAALLASLIPVLKLARMQPVRLVKIFADER